MKRLLIVIATFAAVACSGTTEPLPDKPIAPLPEPEPEPEPMPELTFVADDLPGPALLLTDPTIDAGQLTLLIRARDLGEVFGIAFRVQFDTDVLAYDSLTRGDAWPAGGRFEARVGAPGEIAFAALPLERLTPDEDGVIAQLRFTVNMEAEGRIRLTHGYILDGGGRELATALGAGMLRFE